MADFRAIEGASRTLRALLRDRMREPVAVTLAPPDIVPDDHAEDRRINLYLLEVREHPQLRNQMPPGQGHPASYGQPPLSLDLVYLLTTHVPSETAADADLSCQRMLGDALGALHDHAIVGRSLLAATSLDRPAGTPLLDPLLLDEHETLKVSLHPTTLEDFAKIWTALPDAAFRRAVMLTASVVQIAALTPRVSPRPVQARRIAVDLGTRPVIEHVFRTPAAPGDPETEIRVRLGDAITVRGRNLAGSRTLVRLGGLDPIEVVPEDAGRRVQLTVPDATYPAAAEPPGPRPIPSAQRLRAGTLTVQVLVERALETVEGGLDDLGTTAATPRRTASDLGLLQLLPEVTGVTPGSATAAQTVIVQGKRLFAPGSATVVLVGDAAIEARRPSTGPVGDDRVEVPLASLARLLPTPPPGGTAYSLRAVVDGAMSAPLAPGLTLLP